MRQRSAIKLLIVEPSAIVVEGLMAILSKHKDFHCLHPLSSCESLREYVRREKPNLLIINPTLPCNFNELAALNIPLVALVYQYVECEMLSRFAARLDIRESREAIPENLRQLLQQDSSLAEVSIEDNYELSDREIDVLKLVAQGLMNKEIADKLNISVYTVISHRKNINRKTGIKSVAGLTVYAIMKGYIASL